MSALERLKDAATSTPNWRKYSSRVLQSDLALALAVIAAAEDAVGDVDDRQHRSALRDALEALTKD